MRSRYAGVTLEFKPLESGHSLMLEYDLILPSSTRVPPLPRFLKQKGELRDLLATWSNDVEKDKAAQDSTFPTLLVHLCDSHYTSKSLSLNVLQDNDRRRATYLKDLCSEIDMGLYIADLERIRCGYCLSTPPSNSDEDDHHSIDEEHEDDTTLTRIVDLDGNEVARSVWLVLQEHIVQSEPFDDDDPDDEDFFEEAHGTVVHYWKRTVRSAPELAFSLADVLQALVLIPSTDKKRKEMRPNKRKRGAEIIDLEYIPC